MSQKIYLDYAAATPVDQIVLERMLPCFSQDFYNPSADYQESRLVKKQLQEARAKIAFWLGVQANEVVFTAGGTEANNLAIKGVMDQYPEAKLLISAIEHDSIRVPASNYDNLEINVLVDGRLDLTKLKGAIDDNVVLISIIYVNNEIGVIEPLKQVALIIAEIKRDRRARGIKLPLYFHSDACQAANYLDLHVNRLGLDLMTINGGKIYGPKQSGALYVKQGVGLRPIIEGGGQEYNLRSGTENVPADIGLAEALNMVQATRDKETIRLMDLRDYFINKLKTDIKGVSLNGSAQYRVANNVHITIADQDNEYLLIKLNQAGIMAAAGSACSASKEESSHVLLAIGLNDDQARSSLRFSLGRDTTKKQLDKVIVILKTICSLKR